VCHILTALSSCNALSLLVVTCDAKVIQVYNGNTIATTIRYSAQAECFSQYSVFGRILKMPFRAALIIVRAEVRLYMLYFFYFFLFSCCIHENRRLGMNALVVHLRCLFCSL